ncbi:MAG: insulinase family protein [Erysipelotrichaceae bacterium]|nr:insulinase family protein [Erysipelotrichaceae bacterium]
MNINDNIHGFTLNNIRPMPEINGELYEMVHDKTRARLIWIKRNDDNKTFAIGFKTTPDDDTGVFHILEHSVLNGSRRYPVKEPFVDLLKGSLQTFLNAMTYPDKTVYPVSSRNDQDFLNLMRVYLDAVFYPLAVTQPNTFRQEGWHYEINDVNEQPIYKGVVFNEMKGAFSSSDGVRARTLMHALFPDTCYGCESGGDPRYITDLTWEKFCANHAKYYNPSNSYIILDGSVDLDVTLKIINDEYLSNIKDSGEQIVIETQKPIKDNVVVQEFEIAPNEPLEHKAQISYGYVVGRYDEYEKNNAFELLSSVLCGSNESPLKKAIIDKGLGEDISFSIDAGIMQSYVEITVLNTDLDKEEEVTRTIRETLKKIVREGVDKDELEATLNISEFRAREKEFGGAPKGLVFALSSLDSWLYGGDPMDGILYDRAYAGLREKIHTDYYERLIEDCILNSNHNAKILLKPSQTLGAEKAEDERRRLAAIKDSWSPAQLEAMVQMNKEFSQWQQTMDTPEQKATLPALKLSDLNDKPEKRDFTQETIGGTTVITPAVDTNGISYNTAYLRIDDFDNEEVKRLSLLNSLVGYLDTEHYDIVHLRQQIKRYLGSFGLSMTGCSDVNDFTDSYYMAVSWSNLTRNDDEALKLVDEILKTTNFDNKQAIINIIRQLKNNLKNSFSVAGHSLAAKRSAAYNDPLSTFSEFTTGYEFFRYVSKLEREWEQRADEEIAMLKELLGRILVRERVILSACGDDHHKVAERFLASLSSGRIGNKVVREPLGQLNEGLIVPANVSFAAKSAELNQLARKYGGKCFVLGSILTYDYLWTRIRVQGGAYGCGFGCSSGAGRFYSYRDPDPANSLQVYEDVNNYLDDFVRENDSVEQYIIGAMGDFDPLLSTRGIIKRVELNYLCNNTYELTCARLKQLLSTTIEDIKDMKEIFEEINRQNNVCVIGNKEALEKCRDKLKVIYNLKTE